MKWFSHAPWVRYVLTTAGIAKVRLRYVVSSDREAAPCLIHKVRVLSITEGRTCTHHRWEQRR